MNATFASKDEFEAWLEEHHATADGLWVKIAKKGTGVPSVTSPRRSTSRSASAGSTASASRSTTTYFLQKYTPRRARSKWSKLNVGQVGELIEAGEMRPAGPRRDRAREGRRALGRRLRLAGATIQVPPDLQAELDARPGGGGVLRGAQLDQPLLDPLPPARRQAARDAGAAAGAVRGDARARRDALLAAAPCASSSPAVPATSARSSPSSSSRAATTSPCSTRSTAATARAVPEGAGFVEADLLDADALDAALARGFDGVAALRRALARRRVRSSTPSATGAGTSSAR